MKPHITIVLRQQMSINITTSGKHTGTTSEVSKKQNQCRIWQKPFKVSSENYHYYQLRQWLNGDDDQLSYMCRAGCRERKHASPDSLSLLEQTTYIHVHAYIYIWTWQFRSIADDNWALWEECCKFVEFYHGACESDSLGGSRVDFHCIGSGFCQCIFSGM